MAKLIYSMTVSLDGYVADPGGSFEFSAPDEEVHTFVNDVQRQIGTYLFGRHLYDVMRVWETLPTEDLSPFMADYASIWRSTDKVVFSSTLEAPSTARTRIESRFDPGLVRRMKAEAAKDLCIGGPTLAAHAIRAGLVDECHQYLVPVLVGGGTPFFSGGVTARLVLLDEHRFHGGTVYLRHRILP